jgi:hypothetical protein
MRSYEGGGSGSRVALRAGASPGAACPRAAALIRLAMPHFAVLPYLAGATRFVPLGIVPSGIVPSGIVPLGIVPQRHLPATRR